MGLHLILDSSTFTKTSSDFHYFKQLSTLAAFLKSLRFVCFLTFGLEMSVVMFS